MLPNKKHSLIALVVVCCCLVGAEASAQDASAARSGATKGSAIEVCKPEGEREYLAHLVCPDSSHPKFARVGSVGMRHNFPAGMSEEDQMKEVMAAMGSDKVEPGKTDYHVIDGYSVKCGSTDTTLFLDMYHCGVPGPTSAPDGFTIIN